MPNEHFDISFLRTYRLMKEHLVKNLINERTLFIQKSVTREITKGECLKLIKLELNVMNICDLAIHHENYNLSPEYIRDGTKMMTLMSNRIDHLYFSMFQMFSIECVLLIEYMEFQWKNKKLITNEMHPLIVLMTKKKCDPQMFIAAGTFEYEKHNIEKARQYFVEGIKIHPNKKALYLEQLWIEVMHLGDVGGGESNEVIAIQVYRNIIKKFERDIDFHILLLDRSIEVKPIWRLQYEIICDLIETYKRSDLMWHKVATLCSEGFIFDHDISFFGYSTDFKDRARCCIETYEKGVQNVSSDMKKRNLMILLTEHIVKIWQINKSINNWDVNVLVKRKMKNVFQMAHFDFGGVLEPEFYVYWATISYDDRPEILKLAVDHNKDDVLVWAEVLDYHIVHNSSCTTIKRIFDAGNLALENKALLLWEIMDSFLQQYCDITMLGEFYEEGAYSPYEEINTVYKVDYLAWCHMYDGISSSRDLFNKLINLEPETKNLYMEMIQCEKQQSQMNLNIIKKLYNLACMKFSHQDNDTSLWAECIEFELKYFGSSSAENIFNAAFNIVKPQLKGDLRRRYQLMTEAHSRRIFNIQPDIVDLADGY
ncbi:uncharacterized protein LOC111041163 [Myzus persicae]|uniref:uncharacterized protein LOC111041163 n=1 Tax=Myzus persicae TaxID=13164 RepID=UPI000B935E2D|nr:uncharacterized protein LOC111041163 [Myzus persicae]